MRRDADTDPRARADFNLAHSAIPGPKWPFFEFREKRLKNGWAYDPGG
eukprot:COSAG02_NODE_28044_length_597_cov_1.277108_1_plen_47_part_10